MKRITNNVSTQLTVLTNPEDDRLLAMRATSYDSYVLLDGKRSIIPRPPLISFERAMHSLFDILASGVRQPGDALKIVRLSDSRIGVYFENASRCEADILDEYNSYIATMDCPSRYARAWRDFVSLILQTAEIISGGLRSVLGHRETADLDVRIVNTADLALISSLSPHVTSLKKMFDVTSVFYANRLMTERWERAFIRGQKHHMGNALFMMVLLNQFLDSGMLTYQDLHDMVQGADDVFNPVVHIREALNREDVGQWLDVSVVEGADSIIKPVRGASLRRALDEIFYRAGTEADGSAQRIEARWREGEGTLSLLTDGDAFRSFHRGSPARERLSEIYGSGDIQFMKEIENRSEARISLIRIGVERRDGSSGGSDGGAMGTGSVSDIAAESGEAALAIQAGAEVYSTSLAAATAARAAVSV